VSEILVNKPKMDSSLEQLGSPGVPKSVNRGAFGDAAFFAGFPERSLNAPLGHRFCCGRQIAPTTTRGREAHDWIAMSDPIVAKPFQSPLGPGDIPIFPALTATDVDHHARAIDIWHLKMGSFLKAQTTGGDS